MCILLIPMAQENLHIDMSVFIYIYMKENEANMANGKIFWVKGIMWVLCIITTFKFEIIPP